jgi:hypothetical protein
MDYKWVRITRKMNLSAAPEPISNPNLGAVANPAVLTNNNVAICWDGKKQKPVPFGYLGCDDPNLPTPMEYLYRVTALAVTPDGSRRMLQAEVADPPPFVTNSAVESWDHVTLNGSLTVDGYDYCSCSCTSTTDQQTKITTTTCVNRLGKVCDSSKYAIYSGGEVQDSSPSETIIAGTSPKIMENAPWDPSLIPELIDRYKDLAVKVTNAPYNWNCPSYDCGTRTKEEFGIPPDLTPLDPLNPVPRKNSTIIPQITYVPGNVTLTAGSIGNGILIIDGDLNIQGGFEFYGLVLVKGVVKFTGGGSGGSGATNIYGAVLAGQQSYVDNIFGGSANIHFDKCALTQDLENNPPKIITAHEVMY